ncbi:MAG: CDP-alcohol phosphatidyltransferase family protein [Deltaproteobacteria bacterium]|jgi:phosphatidylglycerophosphate synthase
MSLGVVILANHKSALLPVFRQPAVVRAARLAAEFSKQVWVLASEEVYQRLKKLGHQFPAAIQIIMIPPGGNLNLPAPTFERERPLIILKAQAIWDRHSFSAFLDQAQAGIETVADWGGVLPAARWAAILPDWAQGPDSPSASAGASLPYLLPSGESGPQEAESRLINALAEATRESDGFLTRTVDRRISRRISPWLARWGIRPNWVTLMGTLIGLTGAWLLSRATYEAHLAGTLMFLAAVIVDGVDGEVARLTLQESVFGHYLDICTDNLVHVAVFVGLALGLSRATGDDRYLYALLVLLGGFGLCALSVYQVLLKTEGSETGSKITRWLEVLANRDFAYLLVVLAVINRLALFLWGAMIGCYVFAISLWVLGRRSQ